MPFTGKSRARAFPKRTGRRSRSSGSFRSARNTTLCAAQCTLPLWYEDEPCLQIVGVLQSPGLLVENLENSRDAEALHGPSHVIWSAFVPIEPRPTSDLVSHGKQLLEADWGCVYTRTSSRLSAFCLLPPNRLSDPSNYVAVAMR